MKEMVVQHSAILVLGTACYLSSQQDWHLLVQSPHREVPVLGGIQPSLPERPVRPVTRVGPTQGRASRTGGGHGSLCPAQPGYQFALEQLC